MWNIIISGVIALVLGIITTVGVSWKKSIEAASRFETEKAQLEQVIKEQKTTIDQFKKIEDDQANIIKDTQEQNTKLEERLQGLDQYLNSDQAVKDPIKECVTKDSGNPVHHGSSEVLKQTIRELSKAAK